MAAPRPRVTIVIPAWQGGQELLDCLASVMASAYQPTSILVIDNGSTDRSIESARRQFPAAEFLCNREKRGFGAACNQGIQTAMVRGDDFVFLLNQGARLESDTLMSRVDLAQRQPRAAAIGVKTAMALANEISQRPALLPQASWGGAGRGSLGAHGFAGNRAFAAPRALSGGGACVMGVVADFTGCALRPAESSKPRVS